MKPMFRAICELVQPDRCSVQRDLRHNGQCVCLAGYGGARQSGSRRPEQEAASVHSLWFLPRWREFSAATRSAPSLHAPRARSRPAGVTGTLRHALRDEYDARRAVCGGPAREKFRRRDDVLDTVDDGRLIGHLLDVHQPLQPQQARAAVLGQRFQQQGQRERRNRTVALQREGCDAIGVLATANGLRDGRSAGWRSASRRWCR